MIFRKLSMELTTLFVYKAYNNQQSTKRINFTFTWQQTMSHNGTLEILHNYVSIRFKYDFPNTSNV